MGLAVAVLVAALVYFFCLWVDIPRIIGAILAAIIVLSAVSSYV